MTKKRTKYTSIDIDLPLDTYKFYTRVAKHSKVPISKIITVLTVIEALKIIDSKKAEKLAKRK